LRVLLSPHVPQNLFPLATNLAFKPVPVAVGTNVEVVVGCVVVGVAEVVEVGGTLVVVSGGVSVVVVSGGVSVVVVSGGASVVVVASPGRHL
jgi:hypothetical protein